MPSARTGQPPRGAACARAGCPRLRRRTRARARPDRRRRRRWSDGARVGAGQVEAVAGEQVRRRGSRCRSPGRPGSRSGRPLRKRSGRHGPELGASARKNAGMPIVSGGGERELARQQREVAGRDRRSSSEQERGEHRLGDEQPRDALDVAQDLAALARPSAGTTPKSPRDEHEVGDRARHLRARCPGRSPGAPAFSAGTSLTPSPTIADVVAAVARGVARRALALGRDAADAGRRAARPRAAPPASLGQRAAVERRARAGMPASRAIAPTVAGRVAREHLQLDVLARRRRRPSRRRSARSRSASTTRPSGRSARRERRRRARRRGSGASAAAERQHAPAGAASRRAPARRAPVGVRRSAPARRARAARRRGRARSSAAARRTAPAPTARRGVVAVAEPRVGDRLQRRVARRRARRVARRARAPARPRRRPSAGTSSTTRSVGLGQRPGLVGADHVDRRERLDRVELLGEHAAPRHLRRGDRRGEADRAGSGPRARG